MFQHDTEVLTSEGFVPFHQIADDHLVAFFDPDTAGFTGFDLPGYVIADEFQDTLLTLSGKHTLCVSPDTVLYVSLSRSGERRANPRFSLRPAVERLRGYNLLFDAPMRVCRAGSRRNCSGAITNNDMYNFGRLIGFFLGDGHAESTNQLVFNLTKERKQAYLREVVGHVPYDLKASGERFVVRYPLLGARFRDWFYTGEGHKCLPAWLATGTVPYSLGILDGLKQSDGYVRAGRDGWVYTTTSPYLVDALQATGAIAGEPFNVTEPVEGTYRLYTARRQEWPHLNDARTGLHFEMVDNIDVLYNVVMPSGLMCIRQGYSTWLVGSAPSIAGCQIVW